MKIKKKALIETVRLELHAYRPEDREALADILMNPEITKTFMVPDYTDRRQYLELADKLIAFSAVGDEKHLEYGIYLNGEILGFVNDCGYDETEIEIGYVIDPAYKGHGYATEAVKAVIADLWTMGFAKVTAGFFEENPASLMVMRKCGMYLNGEEDTEEYRGAEHRCFYCEILNPRVIIGELTGKDDAKAYALVKNIAAASVLSDEYYRLIGDFAGLLTDSKSYVRTRAFILICSQARWDAEGRIKALLPLMANLLNDPKPTVVRQCLSALKEVAVYRPELSGDIKNMLSALDLSVYKDTMRPLIAKDIKELYPVLE